MSKFHRYSLVLKSETFVALREIAQRRGVSVKALILDFCKLGLLAIKATDAGGQLIVKSGGTEKEILL